MVAFDDAYAAFVQDPEAFYGPHGIHFANDFGMGVIGGEGNGDPGNWNIEGTNGSAAWGMWSGPHAIFFDAPVRDFRMDFLRAHQDVEMEVHASLAGEVVATQYVFLMGPFAVSSVSFEGLEIDRVSWENWGDTGADNITYTGNSCP